MKNEMNENAITPEFQQAEPPELTDADLLGISGGTLIIETTEIRCGCYKPNPN